MNTLLTPLQHAFAIHLLHRAWLHLLQNHSATPSWPTDWDAMKILTAVDQRVTDEHDFGQPVEPFALIQLSLALAHWREGRFPDSWDKEFAPQAQSQSQSQSAQPSAKESPNALSTVS